MAKVSIYTTKAVEDSDAINNLALKIASKIPLFNSKSFAQVKQGELCKYETLILN